MMRLADNVPLYWDVTESPLGALYMSISEMGLYHLSFGIEQEGFLNNINSSGRLIRNSEKLEPYVQQIKDFFAGTRDKFELPVDLSRLSGFRQQALQATADIPKGQVKTYGQIALQIGHPGAARAVGLAMAANPVPLVIPCHRVVGSDGELHGYSGTGGIETKKWLLQFEGALKTN